MWNNLAEFCEIQQRQREEQAQAIESFPDTTIAFLDRLNLSTRHPFCCNNNDEKETILNPTAASRLGPLLWRYHDLEDSDSLYSVSERLVTWYYMNIFPWTAVLGLLCRLCAGYLAPLGVGLWLGQRICSVTTTRSLENGLLATPLVAQDKPDKVEEWTLLRVVTILSCWIVMVDTMYVYEYGGTHWNYGFQWLLVALLLSISSRRRDQRNHSGQLLFWILMALLVICPNERFSRFCSQTVGINWTWDPDTTINNVPYEGLYYTRHKHKNPLVHGIVQRWPKDQRTYTHPTRWMLNGDIRTGLPFLLYNVPNPVWYRVFLTVQAATWSSTIEVEDDYGDNGVNHDSSKEVVALDICFPPHGHDDSQPIYLILHGANGGSQEAYVQDFAHQYCMSGSSTVVVLVARGLMDLPLQSQYYYHAGRVSDLHAASTHLRRAMASHQILAGVGYSMGAIVLSHYAVVSGANRCALDAAFSISGSLECRFQQTFLRSQQLWQPVIAHHIKTEQHLSKWGELFAERSRAAAQSLVQFFRASNMVELDDATHRPSNLTEFYANMSALGDVPFGHLLHPPLPNQQDGYRIHNLSIPLCILHALDDPISTWRNVISDHPRSIMHPFNLVETGHGHLMLLLTRRGGHVGWPQGWLPWRHRWSFMNTAAGSFVHAVVQARKEKHQQQ